MIEEILKNLTKEQNKLYVKYLEADVKGKIKIINDHVEQAKYISNEYSYILTFYNGKLEGLFSAFAGIVYQIDPQGLVLVTTPEQWKELFPDNHDVFRKYVLKKASHAYEVSDNMIKNFIISKLGDLTDEAKDFYAGLSYKELSLVRVLYKKYGFDPQEDANYKGIEEGKKERERILVEKSLVTMYDKVEELYPQIKRLTYKGMLEDYYEGFSFKEGGNAPKLSKQLSKQGIEYTDKELVHWGEVKQFFQDITGDGYVKTDKGDYTFIGGLFVDTENMEIPDNVDCWAFRDSCNNSRSSTGKDTHLLHKWLGFKYLKLYSIAKKGTSLILYPYSRAYFYQDEETGDLGVSGSYTHKRENYNTSYEWTKMLLCVMFGKKLSDFMSVEGGYFSGSHERGIFQEELGNFYYNTWSNMHYDNDYRTYGTCSDILSGFDRVTLYKFLERQEDIKPMKREDLPLSSFTFTIK